MSGSGSRSERVRIERETPTTDAGGGRSMAWTLVVSRWADVQPVRASESERQGAVRTLSVYQFAFDARSLAAAAVTTRDRLVWRSQAYNIREIRTPKPGVLDATIIAETGVSQ